MPIKASHISIAVEKGIMDITPCNFSTLSEIQVARHIYEPLLRYSPDSTVRPGIFSGWKESERGKKWNFNIRKNTFFHNNAPIDADSVIWNLNEHISWSTGLFKYFKEVKKINEYAIQLELTAPLTSLPHRFSSPQAFVLAPPATRKGTKNKAVGSGPFKLAGRKRNDNYVVERIDKKNINRNGLAQYLTFKEYNNGNEMWNALTEGEVDIIYECPYEYITNPAFMPQFVRQHCNSLSVNMILINNEGSFFGNVSNRRLFAAAIDKQKLINKAMHGVGLASTGPISPASNFYTPPAQSPSAQTGKSNAVRNAGTKVPILVQSCYNPGYINELCSQALEGGIHCELKKMQMHDLIEQVRSGEYEAAFLGTAGMQDPDILLYDFFHSKGRNNFSRFRNSGYDSLVDKGRRTFDFSKRKEIYRQAVSILNSEVAAIFLRHGLSLLVHHERIGGIEPYPDNFLRLEDATSNPATL